MSKKKYKLKGVKARLSRFFNFGTTPEGEQFIEIYDNINKMRIYENGVQEFYKNGELVYKISPPLKTEKIKVEKGGVIK